MDRMIRRFGIAKIIGLAVLVLLVGNALINGGFLYAAAPLSATVVDAATREPVGSANVVANWHRKGGLEGGKVTAHVMVMETTTDANGRFHFPGWGPRLGFPSGEILSAAPELWIFKSGYRYQRLMNASNKPAPFYMHSMYDGAVIPLERFGGDLEAYAHVTSGLNIDINSLLDNDECNWQRIPSFLWALEQEDRVFVANKTRHRMRGLDYMTATYTRNCGDLRALVERQGK